jgi:hypothetical protein
MRQNRHQLILWSLLGCLLSGSAMVSAAAGFVHAEHAVLPAASYAIPFPCRVTIKKEYHSLLRGHEVAQVPRGGAKVDIPACGRWEVCLSGLPAGWTWRRVGAAMSTLGQATLAICGTPERPGIDGAGLKALAQSAKTLAGLRLTHCNSIVDEDMKTLAACKTLKRLTLLGCKKITAVGIRHLQSTQSLESLSLLNFSKVETKVMAQVKEISSLREIEIMAHQIEPGAMATIAAMKNLRHLSLLFVPLRDEDLTEILKMTHLRELSLFETRSLKIKDLARLAALTNLESLCLPDTGHYGPRISSSHFTKMTGLKNLGLGRPWTGKDLAQLGALEKLETIRLAGGLTDMDLLHLRKKTNLRELNLGASKATDAGMICLEGLTELRTLELPQHVSDNGFVHLAGLAKLEVLKLPGSKISGVGLKHLSCALLREVQLKNTKMTAKGLGVLGAFKTLRKVNLMNATIPAGGLTWMKGRGIRRLNLSDAKVPLAELEHVAALNQLEVLRLPDGITDEQLASFQCFGSLRELGLPAAKISDRGLGVLAKAKKLQWLHMGHLSISGKGLAALTKLPALDTLALWRSTLRDGLGGLRGATLQRLQLLGVPVTDADLEHLATMKSLREIHLEQSKLTNAGLMKLHGLSNLEELSLVAIQGVEKGLAGLKKAIPGLKIRVNGRLVTP